MMVIELARFRIHDGAEEEFLAERPGMIAALRRRFPGCLAAFLTREDDGGWLDVIVWRDAEAAEESAQLITTVPECAAWLRHIADSSGIRHVSVADSWVAERLVVAG
ncbi:antibiotic biosynthesis monooxygenase [Actinophytocola oryzae]|uniref:Antibiotic biosynthesis monooxygenase n=1 Tax=Actinophytocola oryzae TaxID=502181 RepID=A0A4R7V707_9PSEU|nr:antibiotic biosynthesis monooxygenase [Actinophytocola oryzae]TDV44810.1 antibiotic biosynthesis monooxygenase [Actinophytocola oryzae]